MSAPNDKDCRRTLLVVEDDLDTREMLQLALEGEGYEVVLAAHGGEGLASLQQARPCLILLDMMMPVMNGLEFLKAKESDAELATIPVVVVSAYHHLADTLSVADFLPKPIDLHRLLDVAERYCGAARA
jgi:CheY-like chemotaxis protein